MDQYSPSITYNIERTIFRSIYQSIDNKDKETFYSINRFLRERLKIYYEETNLKAYGEYTNSYVYYYEYALQKLNSSVAFRDMYEICANTAAGDLKERLVSRYRFVNDEEISLDEKRKINDFGKVTLEKFSELVYLSIKYKDFNRLSIFLNELYQVSNSYNHNYYHTKYEIESLSKKELSQTELQSLKELQDKYEVDSYIDNYVRRIYKATLFWCYYLYGLSILNFDDLTQVDTILNNYTGFIERDFLDDLLFLRRTSFSREYSWNHWDYMERQNGVVYQPPSVHYWITFGTVIHLLKTNDILDYNSKNKDAVTINEVDSLLSSIEDILKYLEKDGYELWGSFFNSQSKGAFESKIGFLKTPIKNLKQNNISERERKIAELPISQNIINNISDIVLKSWQNNNIIRELFEHFGNVSLVSGDIPKEFFIIGDKKSIWPGMKVAMIEDKNYYIPYMGIEEFGKRLAQIEENVFISALLQHEVDKTKEVLEAIDQCIGNLSKKGFSASVILCSLDEWYNTFSDLKNKDFEVVHVKDGKFPFSEYGGRYKGLPVLKIRSDLAKNKVVVADFKQSCLLKQYVEDLENKNPMKIEIQEITSEMAEQIINSNPDYWKRELNQEEAIINLRNSVKYSFYTILKFDILNKDAYCVILGSVK